MDAVALARFQFAFTVAYHFFFVPLSIGLGLIMVLFERRYYKSQSAEDKAWADVWVKIFTATFTIGVATGVTMEFAFGTNWAAYSRFVGDIFGAPLAAEGLFAFFLESTFLGVLLFGRNRVSSKFYYVSSWLVWAGSLLSALWIIIANSWMQTPAGYKVEGGKAILTNFFAAGFNPSTLPRYAHTVSALLIAGGCMAAAVGAYHVLKGVHKEFGRTAISIGLVVAALATVAILFTGHWQAVEVVDQQPVKMAAMEGHWDNSPIPLGLLGYVDTANKKTVALEVPGGVSFLSTLTFTKAYPGLNDFAKDPVKTPLPPLQATYQTYHLMIIVFAVLLVCLAAFWWLNRTGKLEDNKALLNVLMWFWLVPELGIQMGWAAAEIGRQPWIVQGLMLTKDGASAAAVVPAYQIALTIALFFVIYAVLFVGWARVVLNAIKNGPQLAAVKA